MDRRPYPPLSTPRRHPHFARFSSEFRQGEAFGQPCPTPFRQDESVPGSRAESTLSRVELCGVPHAPKLSAVPLHPWSRRVSTAPLTASSSPFGAAAAMALFEEQPEASTLREPGRAAVGGQSFRVAQVRLTRIVKLRYDGIPAISCNWPQPFSANGHLIQWASTVQRKRSFDSLCSPVRRLSTRQRRSTPRAPPEPPLEHPTRARTLRSTYLLQPRCGTGARHAAVAAEAARLVSHTPVIGIPPPR